MEEDNAKKINGHSYNIHMLIQGIYIFFNGFASHLQLLDQTIIFNGHFTYIFHPVLLSTP